mgnify:CR=1 FL=1
MEEGVEMIEKVLRKMKEGGTIDELAAELDMRESTVHAMIEFMIRDGYLGAEKGMERIKER